MSHPPPQHHGVYPSLPSLPSLFSSLSPPPHLVCLIDFHISVRQQQLHHLHVTVLRGNVQRRESILRSPPSSAPHEGIVSQHPSPPPPHCTPLPPPPHLEFSLVHGHVCVLQQQLHHLHLTVMTGRVQRRDSILCTFAQQCTPREHRQRARLSTPVTSSHTSPYSLPRCSPVPSLHRHAHLPAPSVCHPHMCEHVQAVSHISLTAVR
jgi:hypothetical protein